MREDQGGQRYAEEQEREVGRRRAGNRKERKDKEGRKDEKQERGRGR